MLLCKVKILIVSATLAEVKPLIDHFSFDSNTFNFNDYHIEVLISGVGIIASTFALTQKLCLSKVDLVINIGVAGTFSDQILNGEVVEVIEEQMADFGAENDNEFLSLFDLKLLEESKFPFSGQSILNENPITSLRKVKSITSTTAHGNETTIKKIKEKHQSDLETMEGFSIFYVCKINNVQFAQIRSISNKVEKRDREKWELSLSIKNLNEYLINYLKEKISY